MSTPAHCAAVSYNGPLQGHSTCVSEHEKYALGATKPGGYAATGFYTEGGQQAAAPAATAAAGEPEVIGLQFLSELPPWKCSCCNVSCTSRDTLLGHATGVKHKRRVSCGWYNMRVLSQVSEALQACCTEASKHTARAHATTRAEGELGQVECAAAHA